MNKVDKLKAHNMTDKVWYHGTGADISEFSHNYAGEANTYGGGFYFTDNPDTASAYANIGKDDSEESAANVIPVHLALTKAVPHDKPFTRTQIQNIITDSPKYKNGFGSADIKNDIDTYSNKSGTEAIGLLQHDFYKGHAKDFFDNITKHTGYDHSIHTMKNGSQYVAVFHPHQIRSVNAKFNPKNIKSGNILESTLRDSLINCLT